MKLLGKTSHFERIQAFMRDRLAESELTEHEMMLINRWNEAFTLIRNYNSTADAVALLMKRFPGLSRASAYRDCSNAISLFGDIAKSTKEGIRHLSTEIVRDSISMARDANDYTEMRLGAKDMASINGVNLTDPDMFNFDEMEPHTYDVKLDPMSQQALLMMIKGGKVDLGTLVSNMGDHAEDAEIIDESSKALENGDS
jgi:hypothetical protein